MIDVTAIRNTLRFSTAQLSSPESSDSLYAHVCLRVVTWSGFTLTRWWAVSSDVSFVLIAVATSWCVRVIGRIINSRSAFLSHRRPVNSCSWRSLNNNDCGLRGCSVSWSNICCSRGCFISWSNICCPWGNIITVPTGISVSTRWSCAVELASTIVHVIAITEDESLATICIGALLLTPTKVLFSPHPKGGASRATIAKALHEYKTAGGRLIWSLWWRLVVNLWTIGIRLRSHIVSFWWSVSWSHICGVNRLRSLIRLLAEFLEGPNFAILWCHDQISSRTDINIIGGSGEVFQVLGLIPVSPLPIEPLRLSVQIENNNVIAIGADVFSLPRLLFPFWTGISVNISGRIYDPGQSITCYGDPHSSSRDIDPSVSIASVDLLSPSNDPEFSASVANVTRPSVDAVPFIPVVVVGCPSRVDDPGLAIFNYSYSKSRAWKPN